MTDLLYKRIKARIFQSYETFMDNRLNQMNVHFSVLKRRYDPGRFENIDNLDLEIKSFLYELQSEVDYLVGQFNGEEY